MRYFSTLEEAASEIERDIAKSPVVKSTRVQSLQREANLHEAMNYSYSVDKLPESAPALVQLGEALGFWNKTEALRIEQWLYVENQQRVFWEAGGTTEQCHPHLEEFATPEADYNYTDRLFGSLEVMTEVLLKNSDSRRAYWPIFHPADSLRAPRLSRIPCSIAYQPFIRSVNDEPYLHLTYTQRACDFKKFWLTDIWLARQWQIALLQRLRALKYDELKLGNTTHFITSLHSFIGDEIY